MNGKQLIALIFLIAILSMVYFNNGEVIEQKIMFTNVEKKIELVEDWKTNLKSDVGQYDIEDNIMYLLTRDNVLNLIDLENGTVIDSQRIVLEEEDFSNGISVNKGMAAINYGNYLIVYDLNSESIILHHQVVEEKVLTIMDCLVANNTLLYWDWKTVFAIDIESGEEVWKFGERLETDTEITDRQLFVYNDRYFMANGDTEFIEFIPESNEVIDVYKVINRGKFDDPIFTAHSFTFENSTGDSDLDSLLLNSKYTPLAGYRRTETGDIFSATEGKLLYYGDDLDVDWMHDFGVYVFNGPLIGQYSVLVVNSNEILVFDMLEQEAVYYNKKMFDEDDYIFSHNDKLLCIRTNGKVTSYSIVKK